MSNQGSGSAKSIRLVFQLDRADNPRLYDDLVSVNKGVKRVNRLRTLAQEGLLAQQYSTVLRAPTPTGDEAVPRDKGDARIVSQVFDEPIVNE